MGNLKEHAMNVFVFDRNGTPIANAVVQMLVNDEPIAEVTTKRSLDAPVSFQYPEKKYESIKLRAKVGEHVKNATVDASERNFSFKFEEIELPRQNSGGTSMKAAWVFGTVLLLFLISLVFWNPSNLAPTSQKVVRLLASAFGGLVSGFFVGSLNLAGRVPKFNNLTIGAVGGFAVFVLVYLVW